MVMLQGDETRKDLGFKSRKMELGIDIDPPRAFQEHLLF